MKRRLIQKLIIFVLIILAQPFYLFAECYDEDACYKDYISDKDKDVVIAVNRDTRQVELYWSEKDNTWLKPDSEYQQKLQKIYNKKLQLMEMQARLNKMRNDTMYTTDNAGSGRR